MRFPLGGRRVGFLERDPRNGTRAVHFPTTAFYCREHRGGLCASLNERDGTRQASAETGHRSRFRLEDQFIVFQLRRSRADSGDSSPAPDRGTDEAPFSTRL